MRRVRWICRAHIASVLLALTLTAAPLVAGLVEEGGTPPDLFLLSSGDVIGYIDPCG